MRISHGASGRVARLSHVFKDSTGGLIGVTTGWITGRSDVLRIDIESDGGVQLGSGELPVLDETEAAIDPGQCVFTFDLRQDVQVDPEFAWSEKLPPVVSPTQVFGQTVFTHDRDRSEVGVVLPNHDEAVIELNGVTSEATHIYHPGTPLTTAYRVLMEQWRLAFDIGAENRRRGVAPTSIRVLVELAREYRQTARAHLSEQPDRPARLIPAKGLGVPNPSA